jgi:hypothetical protein
MRVKCSGSITRDTGVDCLSLYHFDWNTPLRAEGVRAWSLNSAFCLTFAVPPA